MTNTNHFMKASENKYKETPTPAHIHPLHTEFPEINYMPKQKLPKTYDQVKVIVKTNVTEMHVHFKV